MLLNASLYTGRYQEYRVFVKCRLTAQTTYLPRRRRYDDLCRMQWKTAIEAALSSNEMYAVAQDFGRDLHVDDKNVMMDGISVKCSENEEWKLFTGGGGWYLRATCAWYCFDFDINAVRR